jgi:hypothetical protein
MATVFQKKARILHLMQDSLGWVWLGLGGVVLMASSGQVLVQGRSPGIHALGLHLM